MKGLCSYCFIIIA